MAKVEARQWPLLIKAGSSTVKIYSTVDRARERFSVAYHEGGIRRLRQFVDLKEARAEAKLIAEKLNAGQGDALHLSGADRDAYVYAVRKLAPSGVSLTVAIDEFMEARKHGVPIITACEFYRRRKVQDIPRKPVSDVVAEFIAAKEEDGASVRYLADARSRLNRFARDFQCDLLAVPTADLEGWLRGLQLSGRSRNNYANLIRTCFRWARAQGFLPKGEPTAAEELQKAKDRGGKIGIFTADQILKLLEADLEKLKIKVHRKNLVPYLVLGGFCGLRHAEIDRLDWSDIDLAQRIVRVGADKAKTATNRIVPIEKNAAAWLSPYKRASGQVCSDRQTKYVREVARKLKIKWPANGLRHSFVSYRLAQIQNAPQVALEAGNSVVMIHRNYRELVTRKQGKAWFEITPKRGENIVKKTRNGKEFENKDAR